MSAETGALLAGEDPYANFNADIPPSTTNVLAVVCKTLCCCWNKKNAAANNPGRSFPRTPVEFRDAGAVWATSVLRDNGRIDRSNSVVSVKVSELGASGLLSELCLASLTLAKLLSLHMCMDHQVNGTSCCPWCIIWRGSRQNSSSTRTKW